MFLYLVCINYLLYNNAHFKVGFCRHENGTMNEMRRNEDAIKNESWHQKNSLYTCPLLLSSLLPTAYFRQYL